MRSRFCHARTRLELEVGGGLKRCDVMYCRSFSYCTSVETSSKAQGESSEPSDGRWELDEASAEKGAGKGGGSSDLLLGWIIS